MMATTTIDNEQTEDGDHMNVLLVGNNPITLGKVYKNLMGIKGYKLMVDFCFDCKKSVMSALRIQPNIIFLDDNLNKKFIRRFITHINRNKKTKDIPITLLKSSNYSEVITSGVQDFLLKDNINTDRLYHALRNASNFKRTARLLKIASLKRKHQIDNWFNSLRR